MTFRTDHFLVFNVYCYIEKIFIPIKACGINSWTVDSDGNRIQKRVKRQIRFGSDFPELTRSGPDFPTITQLSTTIPPILRVIFKYIQYVKTHLLLPLFKLVVLMQDVFKQRL